MLIIISVFRWRIGMRSKCDCVGTSRGGTCTPAATRRRRSVVVVVTMKRRRWRSSIALTFLTVRTRGAAKIFFLMQFSTSLAALTSLSLSSLSFLSHAGVFETNAGIPIVVVVTKADLIDSKAAENPLRRVSEDKLDAVQVRVLFFSFNRMTEYLTNLMLLLNDY